ncbi:hypothetical protein PCJ38_28775, partial [Klebsiella pneumoniae]
LQANHEGANNRFTSVCILGGLRGKIQGKCQVAASKRAYAKITRHEIGMIGTGLRALTICREGGRIDE